MSKPKERIALLTNCTSSAYFEPLVDIADAPDCNTMDELCEWWVAQVLDVRKEKPEAAVTPGALYAGISFDTVTEIAQIIGHDNIYVVNRGAGLVRMTDTMIPYNFTYDKDVPGSAYHKVLNEKFMPPLWWSKVNHALYGEEWPISKIKTPEGEDYDYILTSLNDEFIRLISYDLSRVVNHAERLIMPLPQSAASFVAREIRASCVPYTMAYARDLNYSRYNKAHKVALKFLTEGIDLGNLGRHARAVREAQVASLETNTATRLDYKELFDKHPELLKASSPEIAMAQAQMKGLRTGTHTSFTGAWRGANGTLELEVSKDEMELARSSLRKVIAVADTSELHTNEEIIRQVGLFVEAVKEEDPTMIFTSKEISAWGKIVFGEAAEKKWTIGSSPKVASLLRTHHTFLGLEQLSINDITAYRLA